MRVVKSIEEYFNIIDQVKGGQRVSIGYVTSANLNVPQVKRKNPETNRMKGYDDYSQWGEGIGGLVKITSYNFNFLNRKLIGNKYKNVIIPATDEIRQKYGLEPTYRKSSTDTMKYGNGIKVYKGDNDEKKDNSYCPQNVYGAQKNSVYYAIDTNGNIVRELSDSEVKPYLKGKVPPSGLSQLRKMGADEASIESYIKELEDLKFEYKKFEAHSILWIACTVNGEKVVYINDNLARAVNDININPQDFVAIAKDRYQEEISNLTEGRTYGKQIIRLTESDLHRVIKESVKQILRNGYYN